MATGATTAAAKQSGSLQLKTGDAASGSAGTITLSVGTGYVEPGHVVVLAGEATLPDSSGGSVGIGGGAASAGPGGAVDLHGGDSAGKSADTEDHSVCFYCTQGCSSSRSTPSRQSRIL